MPRVLLEAALAGVQIVTRTMPGAEVIRDGWNGFLVPPGAPSMLAAKILELLGNRENGRVVAGRAAERVRKEFSVEHVVACQAAVYRDLIDSSRGTRLKDDKNTREERAHPCGAPQ
nr:glycosyltransferase [Mesorhizobium atlanticum]